MTIRFALMTTSAIAALYMLEFFLWSGIVHTSVTLEEERMRHVQPGQVQYDMRTKIEVVMDLRRQGMEAYLRVPPLNFLKTNGLELDGRSIYPLSGVSDKLTVHCNESGKYSLFRSDEHGFKSPKGLYGNEQLDIVLIGDSFTVGACVEPGEDIGALLRQTYGKVLNLGYGGNGPLLELATLKEYGEPFKPKYVVWIYFEGNDLEDLSEEKAAPFLLQYLDRNFSQKLLGRRSEVDAALINYIKGEEKQMSSRLLKNEERSYVLRSELLSMLKLSTLRSHLTFKSPAWNSNQKQPPLGLFRQILSEAANRIGSWGGQLYFVYLPGWDRYGKIPSDGNLYHREEVMRLVKELELRTIDFSEVMSGQDDPLSFFPFRLQGHYNADGYRLLADTIRARLDKDRQEMASAR